MSKITICPHFFIDYNLTSPEEIYREIIKPLYECLDESNKQNIKIVLSKEILLAFGNSYPWVKTADNDWAGHLRDWYALISPSILKAEIINVENAAPIGISNCSLTNFSTVEMFARFLTVFGSHTMHGGLHEEGVFISNNCVYPAQLQSFLYVIDPRLDLIKVVHPWLRVYKKPLPYEGEFPFIPPKNWRNYSSPIKGTLRGFLDSSGNIWEWDRMHNDHWDVQHSLTRGDYTNISQDGRVLSKDACV
jgi:hypothetical protein